MSETQISLVQYPQSIHKGAVFEERPFDAAAEARALWKQGAFVTQAQKMMALFRHAQIRNDGFVPTRALQELFAQYNARILELRNGKIDGIRYAIVAERRNNVSGFVYKGITLK